MGIVFGQTNPEILRDPERVLPVVINQLLPIGLKGLLVAGLMAAGMSTFDSLVNAGASYWVKDIYQGFINSDASDRQLMRHSRWSSLIIVVIGLLLTLNIQSINEIWGWLTMSIGAGMLIPQLLRWYWWRMNGYGFAAGIAVGMISAIVQRIFLPGLAEYLAFLLVSSLSLAATLLGTIFSQPPDFTILRKFYTTTRPFGFWRPVRKTLSSSSKGNIKKENRRDIWATFLAVPWQMTLFLTVMVVLFKNWQVFFSLLGLLILLSTGLYFLWFRHLSDEVEIQD